MTLTPMQEAAAAAIRQQVNLILLSPTGSGKTLAFLLPTLERIDSTLPQVQAVVVVPTRELALQIEEVQKMQEQGIRSLCLYGGRPAMEEHRRLKAVRPQLIIATPGRLLDHIDKENLNIRTTRILILDEYDKCLELGFREEMNRVFDAFRTTSQMVLTSATLLVDEEQQAEGTNITALSKYRTFETLDFLGDTVHHPQHRISVYQVPSPDKDKLPTLLRLLTKFKEESSIVFVAHRESAERIGRALKEEGFSAVVYHGGMDQEMRERALYRFRAGAAITLVSTDLAARGLDIPQVRHIVHYHLPLEQSTFVHRSGRTARWEDRGSTYLIVGPTEQLPEFLTEAPELCSVEGIMLQPFRPEWVLLYVGRGKKDGLSKADVLGFLCKKGGLNATQIGRIDVTARAAYVAVKRAVVNTLLRQISDEKIKGMKTLIEEMRR